MHTTPRQDACPGADGPAIGSGGVSGIEGQMARYLPGSQSRATMAQKEMIARQLLNRGLTTTQIAAQLRCSPAFVRRVRACGEVEQEKGSGAAVWPRTA